MLSPGTGTLLESKKESKFTQQTSLSIKLAETLASNKWERRGNGVCSNTGLENIDGVLDLSVCASKDGQPLTSNSGYH